MVWLGIPKPLLLFPLSDTNYGVWGLNSETHADETSDLPMESSPRLHPYLLLTLSVLFSLPRIHFYGSSSCVDAGCWPVAVQPFSFLSRTWKKPVLSSSWRLFLKSGCHRLICMCETCLADSDLVFNFSVSTTR